MSLYLGDNKLSQFLEENEKNAKLPLQMMYGDEYDDEYENLYKDLDPSNFQVDDKNIEALQRIIKINEEIRKNLIEEEHAKKMKVIDQMNVEQNQQFWTSVFEKRSAANQANNTSNSQTKSNQQLMTNLSGATLRIGGQQTIDSDRIKENNRSSQLQGFFPKEDKNDTKQQQLKYYHDYIHRNVNYNAHPSNPSLKPVLTGKFLTDNIKFTKVSDNQPINMVSSMVQVEKDLNLKKESILNKNPYSSYKDSNNFHQTFHQSTFYSSGSVPPHGHAQSDIQIKYPQIDKNQTSQFIIPKERGKKLTYEEEMKLINTQTKKDNPLYLNKFNARNYLTRVAPMSQNSVRSPQKQRIQMAQTITEFNKTQNTLNRKDSEEGLNITNALHPLSRKLNQPFQLDKFGIKQIERKGLNINTNADENILIKVDDKGNQKQDKGNIKLDLDNQKNTRQNFFTKNKDYYKDEISSVFRLSQKDLLFKINGPSWKQQVN